MNKLFLISGPSGSGKTTIMRRTMDNEVVSFTTRQPRPGEVDGVDYHFITKERFDELKKNDGLIESSEYGGNFYGITKEELDTKIAKGPAFVIVDYNGAQRLAEVYPHVVAVFIYARTNECRLNMLERGSSPTVTEQRLSTYHTEVLNRVHYDYVIRNIRGELIDAVDIMKHIIHAEVRA